MKKVNMLVEELGLNARCLNALKRSGINNVSQLINLDKASIYKIRNLGVKSGDIVISKVHEHGYLFSWEPGFEEQSIDSDKYIIDIDSYLDRIPISNLGFSNEALEYLKSKRKKTLSGILSMKLDSDNEEINNEIVHVIHSKGLKFSWEKNNGESIPNASYLLLTANSNSIEIENNNLEYEVIKREEIFDKMKKIKEEKNFLESRLKYLDEEIEKLYTDYINSRGVNFDAKQK